MLASESHPMLFTSFLHFSCPKQTVYPHATLIPFVAFHVALFSTYFLACPIYICLLHGNLKIVLLFNISICASWWLVSLFLLPFFLITNCLQIMQGNWFKKVGFFWKMTLFFYVPEPYNTHLTLLWKILSLVFLLIFNIDNIIHSE